MTFTVALSAAAVLVCVVAVYFVARAAVAIVATQRMVSEQQTVLYKQAKDIAVRCARTEATARRILDREYDLLKQVDIVLLDPKVQRALAENARDYSFPTPKD